MVFARFDVSVFLDGVRMFRNQLFPEQLFRNNCFGTKEIVRSFQVRLEKICAAGHTMVDVKMLVYANFVTLGSLGLLGLTFYVFEPYLATVAWAQIWALGLRNLRDKVRRKNETEGQAAQRLLLYVLGGFAVLMSFVTLGLAMDLITMGDTLAKAGDATKEAKGWLALQTQEVMTQVKPHIFEAAEPYVDFESMELHVDAIVEKIPEDYEDLGRQVLETANGLLTGEVSWTVLKDEAMKHVETLKTQFQENEGAQETAKAAAQEALKLAGTSLNVIAQIMTWLASKLAASLSSIVACIVFIVAVFAQLARPDQDLDEIVTAVVGRRQDVIQKLAAVGDAVVVAPIFRGILFAGTTFTLVFIAGAGCPTLAGLVAFFSGLFHPIVPSLIASVPWALALLLRGHALRAGLFLVAHFLMTSRIARSFSASLAALLDLPTSVVTLAYVLGVQRLGPDGMLLGPLLLAVAVILLRLATAPHTVEFAVIDEDTTPKPSSSLAVEEEEDDGDDEVEASAVSEPIPDPVPTTTAVDDETPVIEDKDEAPTPVVEEPEAAPRIAPAATAPAIPAVPEKKPPLAKKTSNSGGFRVFKKRQSSGNTPP